MTTEILSVTQLNRRARDLLQKSFPLLWVAGEISNLTHAASGHIYFSLKDDSALIRCVMFRNRAQLLSWRPENGQQVEARVLVTLYEARGDFQLNVETLHSAGAGKLYEAYARLRALLEAEGLFSPERKRPLPRFPGRIGIVTSPQTAALHDILTTLRRRAPNIPLVLYPAPVQGEGAADKLARAINEAGRRARSDQIDVLILARGGGSIEDLWSFNEACVARAIADSPLPIISGIGHETDTSIADLVADQRAATPTAAAELASAGWFDAADEITTLSRHLKQALLGQIETRSQRLDLLAHRLLHPGQRLGHHQLTLAHLKTRLEAALARQIRRQTLGLAQIRQKLQGYRPDIPGERQTLQLDAQRLKTALHQQISHHKTRLQTLSATLSTLNPEATLQRGYTIVRGPGGDLIRNSEQLNQGSLIELRFSKGSAHARIEKIHIPPPPPPASPEAT